MDFPFSFKQNAFKSSAAVLRVIMKSRDKWCSTDDWLCVHGGCGVVKKIYSTVVAARSSSHKSVRRTNDGKYRFCHVAAKSLVFGMQEILFLLLGKSVL